MAFQVNYVTIYHPSAIAKLLFPTMMKMIIHGHEPLEFKGGRLTEAYKGRGPQDASTSYRSLLMSNHLGKAIHRAIRLQHSDVYEKFLQAQQTGGRRGVPVQLPLHQARAFVRQARAKRSSFAILYLDLTKHSTAFCGRCRSVESSLTTSWATSWLVSNYLLTHCTPCTSYLMNHRRSNKLACLKWTVDVCKPYTPARSFGWMAKATSQGPELERVREIAWRILFLDLLGHAF